MIIIPVIDLMNGQVVHAKQGQRNQYQSIQSKLSNSAKPETVLSCFLELYPFKIIYIADLDAILKKGTNWQIILDLAFQYKQCEFWVDSGIDPIIEKNSDSRPGNIKYILGSENKMTKSDFNTLLIDKPELILSLDFDDNKLKENNHLLNNTRLWPEKIITMMLSRVGANKGIDMQCLDTVLNLAGSKKVYAAGGVRNKDDLIELKSIGVNGVLLATALHNGTITKEDIQEVMNNYRS